MTTYSGNGNDIGKISGNGNVNGNGNVYGNGNSKGKGNSNGNSNTNKGDVKDHIIEQLEYLHGTKI